MTSLPKALLFGVFIWLLTFAATFGDLRAPRIAPMPPLLALLTVIFGLLYLRSVERRATREGLFLGLIFVAVNLAIDLPLTLSPGQMHSTLGGYFADIGLTYALLPLITMAIGYARAWLVTRSALR